MSTAEPRRLLLVAADPRTADRAAGAGFHVRTLRYAAHLTPQGFAARVRRAAARHGAEGIVCLDDGPAAHAVRVAADTDGLALTSAESVRRLTDPAGLRQLLDEDGRFDTRGQPPAGPGFGVHTLTVHGVHHVLVVTTRRPATGTAHIREIAPAAVGGQELAELRSVVTALLDLADFQFGFADVHVVPAHDGPRVLAVRAGSGSRAGELLRATAGFDPETWLFRGLAGEPVPRPVPRCAAAVDGLGRVLGTAPSPSAIARAATVPAGASTAVATYT
ncbi:hypothetical protein [Streptomyces sp. NPDC049813]|uniref:hypothetical protein n=1 Tax=Streptomyces sp. NPDC049813 TaxID=3365597 RepID=UPI0037B8FD7F